MKIKRNRSSDKKFTFSSLKEGDVFSWTNFDGLLLKLKGCMYCTLKDGDLIDGSKYSEFEIKLVDVTAVENYEDAQS